MSVMLHRLWPAADVDLELPELEGHTLNAAMG